MIQNLIVALIVLASACFVARKYLPKILRRRLAGFTAKQARRTGFARLARWLEAELPAAASCGDGCGTCGSCGPAPAVTQAPAVHRISADSLRRGGVGQSRKV